MGMAEALNESNERKDLPTRKFGELANTKYVGVREGIAWMESRARRRKIPLETEQPENDERE